jgi:transposase
MNNEHPLIGYSDISDADWERTPASVKGLIERLVERVVQLEAQVAQLQAKEQLQQEQITKNSHNSSQPPSTDPLRAPKRKSKQSRGKKRGAQPGHEGHQRRLYPIEACRSVTDHYPESCKSCGSALSGEDSTPYRHQIVEMPPVMLEIEEHRLHQRMCQRCGTATRAQLPPEVCPSGYGPRVVAITAVLSGMYRHSQRMVQSAMQDVFGVEMSLGSVNNLRQEASDAVADPVAAAVKYVQQQSVVGADETSLAQGNADGHNPNDRTAWLWVIVTPLVTCFQVLLSRGQEAAQTVLGLAFAGILTSDRHAGYNWVELSRRQLCWAHLKRDFTQIAERSGVSEELGKALLEQQKQLFNLWHQWRGGVLERHELISAVNPIRQQVKALLEQAASYEIGVREKTPLAKTVRTCRQLLKDEPAMWLFVTVEGVEPTNNAAERAIRPAVLWRRTSFGTQSQAGSTFMARILTVVMTLRSQNRHVLEYMTDACRAVRQGKPAPSLLP